MISTKEKLEFAFLMARHSKASLEDIQRLMRYGATIQRITTNRCNGYQKPGQAGVWDGVAEDADRRKYNQVTAKVILLCKSFGAKVIYQSDPRGCTLKIAVPDGYTNDLGREGICVPTS